MGPCSVYNSSLTFARNAFGILALLAYFFQSQWLVFVLGIVMAIAAISLKYNLAYQFHSQVLKKFLKSPEEKPIIKDSGEISFAWAMAASFLLLPSLLFAMEKWQNLAWVLILIDSLLLLLAGIAGACVASIMYALLKKIFRKR